MIRRQALFRTSNRRSAIVLGVLLALLIAAASFVVIRIYTQLDRAASLERRTALTERGVSDLLNAELQEEAALRSFAVTGQRFFIDPYREGAASFTARLRTLQEEAASLGNHDLVLTVADIKTVHENWEEAVALPTLEHPHLVNPRQTQTYDKILIDQIRSDINGALESLAAEAARGQADLRRTIDQSLFGGLATVLVFGAIGFVFVASRTQMLATIDRNRSIVDTLQGAFRTDLDAVTGISIGTAYLSATQDAAVGGDLYDVRRIDDTRALVMVADVSGKGVEAAVNTAFVKYSIRTLAHSETSPAAILGTFNAIFLETIKNPNLFVVAFVGVIDTRAHRLTYASAGHSGAYLRTGATVTPLEVTGTVIGLDATFTYGEKTIDLNPGDLVLLATDGLTEARDHAGDVLDDAGAMALLGAAPAGPQAVADFLAAAVRARSGNEPADDLAIMAIGADAGTA